MVKFNKEVLLDDISKILATLDGKAYDPFWGKHIATSEEPVQCYLVAKELKRLYPKKYKNIFITKIPSGFQTKRKKVMTNDASDIYNSYFGKKEDESLLKNIDMLIEYTDFWLLIQFKLLRPMGGKLRRFGEDFFKQFLPVEKFDSGFYPNKDSSIANDIVKFDKISQKPVGGKKIKKLVIAIYYPSDNLWPNQENKVDRLQKKWGKEFKSKINDLKKELKKCENKIDIDFYKKKLEDIFSPLKYKYKESRPKKIIPMTMKIKPIGEFKQIKPNKSQAKWNFSEFFHTQVKLLSWEITKSVKEKK